VLVHFVPVRLSLVSLLLVHGGVLSAHEYIAGGRVSVSEVRLSALLLFREC
jgi:hypothetical protein